MKVVVTGGAGYCGVPLCQALLTQGHMVTLVDNLMFGIESILHLIAHPNIRVIQRDIRHSDRSYLDGQDAVFHLAAISGYPECEANAHSARAINVTATEEIAAALSPSQLLIFPSTSSFYGASGQVNTEETKPSPVSLYGTTKWEAEQRVMQRENSIALRWTTVFGVSPRMRSGLIVNDLTAKAVHERIIVLYDPDSRRSFVHVSDLVRGYMFALERSRNMAGGVFNMGSERLNLTKRDLAACIQDLQPCKVIDSGVMDKDVRNFIPSFEKIRALGFDTNVSLGQGVSELIKLYLVHTPHYQIRPI